jgi:hypothetical protein
MRSPCPGSWEVSLSLSLSLPLFVLRVSLGNNIDTVQLIAQRFQSKYNQDLRKVGLAGLSALTVSFPQVLQEYTGSYYRQAMLAYLEGLQPLGSIEAEMALWLTPSGGEAQEGRIEFLAQALNNVKVSLSPLCLRLRLRERPSADRNTSLGWMPIS